MTDLQRTTEIAIDIAQQAGALALKYYGKTQALHKGDGSLVTEADREAEKLIRSRLSREFPDHGVVGEEFGGEGAAGRRYTWYIDPIDGTSNFVFGLPLWGVSLGLTWEQRPVAGVFTMPASQETYWGWQDGGAYQNGQRLEPNATDEMRGNDLISISSNTWDTYRLNFPQKMRCLGSAAHALTGVAAGHFAAAIQDNWYIHDMAAALCFCQETGVMVTDNRGRPFADFGGLGFKQHGPTLIAAGPHLHHQVLATVTSRSGS